MLNKYKYVDQVIEFDNVDALNGWLLKGEYVKINKVYRNADLKYFIYYKAKIAKPDV
jgi:hypothetical protein